MESFQEVHGKASLGIVISRAILNKGRPSMQLTFHNSFPIARDVLRSRPYDQSRSRLPRLRQESHRF